MAAVFSPHPATALAAASHAPMASRLGRPVEQLAALVEALPVAPVA